MENNYTISLDLGCTKVTAALGELAPNGELIVRNIVSEPMEGLVRGEISNIESVTASIKSAVERLEAEADITVESVVVGSAGRSVLCADNSGFVYVGSDGEIVEDDVCKLKENMNNVQAPEGRLILERIPQRYKIDACEIAKSPVGHFGRQLEATYSFVLAGKPQMERIGKALERVGIRNKRFVASAMASGAVAATSDEKDMGVAVVDIGAGTTDLCVYQGGVVRYVASIPLGSADIDADIKAVAIPPHAVEKIKIQHGYATASAIPYENLNNVVRVLGRTNREKNKDISFRDLSAIIECRLLDIVEFLVEELKRSGYNTLLGAGIILTGGCSKLRGIDTLLKERTGHDVRLGYAEEGLSPESIEGLTAPNLTTAIGLLKIGLEGTTARPRPAVTPKVGPKEQSSNKKRGEENQSNNKQPSEQEDGKKGGFFSKFFKRVGDKVNDVIFNPTIDDEEI